MTLNQITYTIASAHKRANDIGYIRQLEFLVSTFRATLLRQDIERNGPSGEYVQTITMPVELVDKADSCYVEVGCKVLRTVNKIALPLNMKGGSPLEYVGSPTMDKPFGYKQLSQIAFSFTGKTSGVYYTLSNGRIYVWGKNTLDFITLSGAFADPTEAVEHCINSERCFNPDDPYPCPSWMIKTIIDGLINQTFPQATVSSEIKTRDKIDEART